MREADSCGSTTIREDDLFAQEEKTHTPGSWDQFEGNQHLIAATSTYDESLYTTPIPENITPAWQDKMETALQSLHREKQTPDTGMILSADEERNHSSVSRDCAPNTSGKGQEVTSQTPERYEPHSMATARLLPRKSPLSSQKSTPKIFERGVSKDSKTRQPARRDTMRRRTCPVEVCNWSTASHGGKWQAYYHHVASQHSDTVPSEWWEKEGRFLCPSCGKHYDHNKKASHEEKCQDSLGSYTSSLTCEPETEEASISQIYKDSLPSLDCVCSYAINTCKDVPFRCRQQWASVLTQTMAAVVRENSVEAWTRLAMLPKCVLPAPKRGGRKGNSSYTTKTSQRMDRWESREYAALWNESVAQMVKKRERSDDEEVDESGKAAKRAELLARQGEFSRAMAALTAAPMAPESEETYEKLQSKHPGRLPLSSSVTFRPIEGEPLHLSEGEVEKALRSFRRGTSAGTMGLRPEHLQSALAAHPDDKVQPLFYLKEVMNLLLSGKGCLQVQKFFGGARLCALEKGENDVRPIAAGETIRRLVSKAACSAVKEKASKLLWPHQYGVATPAGAERLIHLCRHVMASQAGSSDFTLCKVDLRNAFNNISRTAFAALTREHFPELSPWVEWCYTTESILTYGFRQISSKEGVQQGDPLGPLLFSLVMQMVTTEIDRQLPGLLKLNLWYLDDGILGGKAQDVRRALDIIERVGPQWGIFLNANKCEAITHPESAEHLDSFGNIPTTKKTSEGNFSILGSPVGTTDFCTEFLREHTLLPAEESLAAIEYMEDPQVSLALIRQCAGFSQMAYSLRTTPTNSVHELCEELDTAILHTTERSICPLNEDAAAQVQRPKSYGGFGLRSSAMHASSAYVSSVSFAADKDNWNSLDAKDFADAVLDVNSRAGTSVLEEKTGLISPQHASSLSHLKKVLGLRGSKRPLPANLPVAPPGDTTTPYFEQTKLDHEFSSSNDRVARQKVLSRAISSREYTDAYQKADPQTRARWISQSGKGAGDWLFVTPSREKGHAFTKTEFRTLCTWWLGQKVYPETHPCPVSGCTLPMGPQGDHALVCKHDYGISARHNALALQFFDVCQKANLSPKREHSLGNRGPGGALTRPGDVFLPSYTLGKGLVFDFAVTHVQQQKYTDLVRSAGMVAAGAFAEKYATNHKRGQRQEAIEAGHDFTAMVVESYGSWSPTSLHMLKKIAGKRAATCKGDMSEQASMFFLLQDMNVTLMRSQARMLVRRMADVYIHASLALLHEAPSDNHTKSCQLRTGRSDRAYSAYSHASPS